MKRFECKECNKKFESDESLKQHIKDKHHFQKKRSINFSFRKIAYYLVFILIISLISYGFYWSFTSEVKLRPVGSAHHHFDLRIYLDGLIVDLNNSKYFLLSPYAHVESGLGQGKVVHKHALGATIGLFLKTVGIFLDDNCIQFEGKKYCKNGKILKIFYKEDESDEWKEVSKDLYNFEPFDKYKVLVYYGNNDTEEIEKQKALVTNYYLELSP